MKCSRLQTETQLFFKTMKTTVFSFALILCSAFIPTFANAGQIIPILYAKKYCELRSLGVSVDDSRKMAIEYSYTDIGEATKILVNGKYNRSDSYMAAIEAVSRCPDLIK